MDGCNKASELHRNLHYVSVLRIRDVYPRSLNLIFSIPDPGYRSPHPTTAPNEEGEIFSPIIFCSHKSDKIVNNFIFEQVKKFFLAKTLRIIVLFTQKFLIKLSKIWVWDQGPRSRIWNPGKNLFRTLGPRSRDPGSSIQGQKGTGSRIRIRNTAMFNNTVILIVFDRRCSW
jgi:hypothetical protein